MIICIYSQSNPIHHVMCRDDFSIRIKVHLPVIHMLGSCVSQFAN